MAPRGQFKSGLFLFLAPKGESLVAVEICRLPVFLVFIFCSTNFLFGFVLIGRGLAECALHLTRAIALSSGRGPWTCPGGSSCFACEALEFYMEVGNRNDAVRSANRLCYPHDYFTCQGQFGSER